MAATTRSALAVKNDFWLRSAATCFSPSETVWNPTQPPFQLRHVCERTIKHLNNELPYLTSHTNTFWTDKTSIQEMLISRSSPPKRMDHYSCQVVDISTSVFHLEVGDWLIMYNHFRSFAKCSWHKVWHVQRVNQSSLSHTVPTAPVATVLQPRYLRTCADNKHRHA